ncbi:hypothetical protein [Streptomyces sp. NPDC051183]|uniref:hypothetical protein n=1 Tax=Streptomyces sp. NPDC051183 TaxID=3155165 RepID=UPI003423C2E8
MADEFDWETYDLLLQDEMQIMADMIELATRPYTDFEAQFHQYASEVLTPLSEGYDNPTTALSALMHRADRSYYKAKDRSFRIDSEEPLRAHSVRVTHVMQYAALCPGDKDEHLERYAAKVIAPIARRYKRPSHILYVLTCLADEVYGDAVRHADAPDQY